MTRRELILRSLRNTLLWLGVTAPLFVVATVTSLLTLDLGAFVVVPFVLGPVYLMLVAGLSQKTLPEAGWIWFLILCFAGAGAAFLGALVCEPLGSLFGGEYRHLVWSCTLAVGAWVMPTLLNMGYLLSFSDEECAILTRVEESYLTPAPV